jgi:hypothetical protein
LGERVPLTVVGARADRIHAALRDWSGMFGAVADLVGRDTIKLPQLLARGDSLLLLALALDRAMTSDARVKGVVFGPVVPPEELARQWLAGEHLMGARALAH